MLRLLGLVVIVPVTIVISLQRHQLPPWILILDTNGVLGSSLKEEKVDRYRMSKRESITL